MTPRLNGPLLWSLAAIAVVVGATVLSFPGIAGTALVPAVDAKTAFFEEAVASREAYEDAQANYIDRFDGRSAFFEPKQPRKAVVDPSPTPVDTEPTPVRDDEPTPKRQPTYSGPKLSGLHGDHAFFKDGTLLRIGEERNGLKLLAVEAPWTARVEYNGLTYERALFERADEGFFAGELNVDQASDTAAGSAEADGVIEGERAAATVPDRTRDTDRDAEGRDPADEDREASGRERKDYDRVLVRSSEEGTDLWTEPRDRQTGRAAFSATELLTETQMDVMSRGELLQQFEKLSQLRTQLAHSDDETDRAKLARVKADYALILQRLRQRLPEQVQE